LILPNPLTQLRSPGRMRDAGPMSQVLEELLEIAGCHARGRRIKTAIPRVSISRSEIPTPPLVSLCEPAALFVLQGVKSVLIGDRVLRYYPASYFIYAVEMPATGQVIEASAARPYLAIGFALDVQAVAALLVDHEPAVGGNRFTTHPVDDDLLDAWRRMMRLLARADGRLMQIRRAIAWIRAHYQEPIQVGHLAELAHMSSAAFHRHFKAATAMSPIQYQKQIRLLEARNLLIAKSDSAARVALAVGYESASQFSREYARQFGASPSRDAARFLGEREAAVQPMEYSA
jgi:AraC-like DNA-binding protein